MESATGKPSLETTRNPINAKHLQSVKRSHSQSTVFSTIKREVRRPHFHWKLFQVTMTRLPSWQGWSSGLNTNKMAAQPRGSEAVILPRKAASASQIFHSLLCGILHLPQTVHIMITILDESPAFHHLLNPLAANGSLKNPHVKRRQREKHDREQWPLTRQEEV